MLTRHRSRLGDCWLRCQWCARGVSTGYRGTAERFGTALRTARTAALAVELGDLSVALEQAAAFIVRRAMPLADYLTAFRARREELWRRESLPETGYAVFDRELPDRTTYGNALDKAERSRHRHFPTMHHLSRATQ